MYLEILTPTKEIFKGNILSLKIPSTEGYLEILKNHAPLLCFIGKGTIRIKDSIAETASFTIDGGILECLNNKTILLTDTIQPVEK